MNTARLRTFAQESRLLLMQGVANRILYWGFDREGNLTEAPKAIDGGYSFREKLYDDTGVPPRWKKLEKKITASSEGLKDTIEEAAYTWFNRLLAIKIMEENGLMPPILAFRKDTLDPMILWDAKEQKSGVTDARLKEKINEAVKANNDAEAFALLIIDFCNRQPLLKEIFGSLDDFTELLIPTDLLSSEGFLALLNDSEIIVHEDYGTVELIGWLYQFYISDRKDEVFAGFKRNRKARAEDIPAATQIFTPKWIVSYMVENTLGKAYLDFEPDSALGEEMKYLVESENESSRIIEDIEELTLIDPACGSGHILVTGMEWLYKMYREQGYNAKSAIENILSHNLFGLEIDDRAAQLARFALMMKAALLMKTVNASEAIEMVQRPNGMLPQIAAFPENRAFSSEEVEVLTEGKHTQEIYKTFDLLRQGKNLGSVIKLDLSEEALEALKTGYKHIKAKAKNLGLDVFEEAAWLTLKDYAEIALILSGKYTAVCANPPYMGQKNMNGELKDYVGKHYPMTKADLFAVFMEVCMNITIKDGLMGMINQHAWMFLSSYEKYRKYLLLNYSIQNMLHLGPRTFEELSGEVVQSTSFVLKKIKPEDAKGNYYRLVDYNSSLKKEKNFLRGHDFHSDVSQSNFEKIPGTPIAYWVSKNLIKAFSLPKLKDYYETRKGLVTMNDRLFVFEWFEVNCELVGLNCKDVVEFDKLKYEYAPFKSGGGYKRWYGNRNKLIKWQNDGEKIKNYITEISGDHYSRQIFNQSFFFKKSLSWNSIAARKSSFRWYEDGFIFGSAGPSLFYDKDFKCVLAFLNSKLTDVFIKIINPTFNFGPTVIGKLPFKKIDSERIERIVEDNIYISKSEWDAQETSWDFEQNSLVVQKADSLESSYRLWQEKVTGDFYQLHKNEEELNRIFIEIYGLEEELTPEVPLKEITILQDELKQNDLEVLEDEFRTGKRPELPIQKDIVIAQLLSYFVGVMMGRYRLDKPGLHIAHPNPTDEELQAYKVTNAAIPFTLKIDKDGILPLMGEEGAFPDDAVKSIRNLVYHIWGEDSQTMNQNFINECLGEDMEKWMTEKFWDEHISGRMYKKKPIYWMFCSNPRSPRNSAFRALVYMHRMNAFTVQQLLINYLHPHQSHIKSRYEKLEETKDFHTREESRDMDRLSKMLSELAEYEQKLKKVANEQITFDLDDGVAVNYAKFEGVTAKI